MKRMWFGTVLLLILLIMGIFVTVSSNRLHSSTSQALFAAADAAEKGNWQTAAERYTLAMNRWQQRHHLVAAITDHEPMEQIDSLFAQLQPILTAQETLSFTSGCRALTVLIEAVGEAHAVNWWNLL